MLRQYILVLLLYPNGNMGLTTETTVILKKMTGQDNKKIVARFLNISRQEETESLALCIGLSYEIIFEFITNPTGVFATFLNPRKHLYGCLKVMTIKWYNSIYIYF